MGGLRASLYRSSVFLTAFRHGIDVRNFDPYLYRDSVPEEDMFGSDLGSTIEDIPHTTDTVRLGRAFGLCLSLCLPGPDRLKIGDAPHCVLDFLMEYCRDGPYNSLTHIPRIIVSLN